MNINRRLKKVQRKLANLEIGRTLHRGHPTITHIDELMEDIEQIIDSYRRSIKWLDGSAKRFDIDNHAQDLIDPKFHKSIINYRQRLMNARKELTGKH